MKPIWAFTLVAAIWALIILGGCEKKRVEKVNAYKIKPGSSSALTPQGRPEQWWIMRHRTIVEEIKQKKVDVIFIGDSITHGWQDEGRQVWQKYYAGRNAMNMGFAGDRTQHVLWRLENGEIKNISPKLAVILIGTNNSNGTDNTAKEIGEGIIAICQKLRNDLPNTKILIMGIFPRGQKPSEQRQKNSEASKLASAVADSESIYYQDINDKFIDSDGTLRRGFNAGLSAPERKRLSDLGRGNRADC